MPQPDFQELFFQTFSERRKPIRYRVRSDSNLPHDIQFINSLVHESRFAIKHVHTSKRTVEIPLIRSCWEAKEETAKHNLPTIQSVLKFGNVRSIRWILGDTLHASPLDGNLIDDSESISGETEYEIDKVFIGESTYGLGSMRGPIEIVLAGYPRGWQLRVTFPIDNWTLELSDTACWIDQKA